MGVDAGPGRTGPERCRLLHIVVVGGGPTGVEFAGELTDFIQKDLHRIDPDRAADIKCAAAFLATILHAIRCPIKFFFSLRCHD